MGSLGLSQSSTACTTLTTPLGPEACFKASQTRLLWIASAQKEADSSQCIELAVQGTVSLCPSQDFWMPRACLADIQISTSSLPVPLWSWQVHTLPWHSPRIHFLLPLSLAASRVNLGQHPSTGFLFPSCHGWQKGMCQDRTEEPLTDEEGQAGNEGFWFNYVKAVYKHRPTGIASKCQ